MRRFKTILILLALQLQLLGVFAGALTVQAQEAPTKPAETQTTQTQTQPEMSAKCAEVLNPPSTVGLSEEQKGQVYAIIGESIDPRFPKGFKYTCTDIAECLRIKHSKSPARETLILGELQNRYAYCIVTGVDGLGLLTNYATTVYQWIAGIAGAICILTIVVSGIQYSIGGLDQESAGAAKDRILRALGGLVILFLSAFILYSINPIFFN